MSATITFIAALAVALLCLPFSAYQSKKLVEVVSRSRLAVGKSGTLADDDRLPRLYVAQSLEVAYGFPAAVLTLVAFGEMYEWSGVAGVLLIVLAVAVTLFFVWLMDPEHIRWFVLLRVKDLSVVSALVIIANIIGLVLSLLVSAPHTTVS